MQSSARSEHRGENIRRRAGPGMGRLQVGAGQLIRPSSLWQDLMAVCVCVCVVWWLSSYFLFHNPLSVASGNVFA